MFCATSEVVLRWFQLLQIWRMELWRSLDGIREKWKGQEVIFFFLPMHRCIFAYWCSRKLGLSCWQAEVAKVAKFLFSACVTWARVKSTYELWRSFHVADKFAKKLAKTVRSDGTPRIMFILGTCNVFRQLLRWDWIISQDVIWIYLNYQV